MLTWQGPGPSLPRCALPPLQPGEAAQFPQLGLRFGSGSAGLGQPALRGFPLDRRSSESRPTSKSAPGQSTPTLFNQAASFRLVTFPEKTEVERSHTKRAQRTQRAGANLPRLKARPREALHWPLGPRQKRNRTPVARRNPKEAAGKTSARYSMVAGKLPVPTGPSARGFPSQGGGRRPKAARPRSHLPHQGAARVMTSRRRQGSSDLERPGPCGPEKQREPGSGTC